MSTLRLRRNVFTAVLLLVIAWAFVIRTARRAKRPVRKRTQLLMRTECTIQVPGSAVVDAAIDKAFARMAEINVAFNPRNPESPLYTFYRDGAPVSDPDILAVVRTALEIGVASDGAFDITVFPLVQTWGFDSDSPRRPDKAKLKDAVRRVGPDCLTLENGEMRRLADGVGVDLGGIAKGYAVAEAARVLREEGITSALIDAGGDLYAMGNHYGKPWKIGIRDPKGPGLIETLDLVDSAVATSGDYERFFEEDGRKYHHILNPKTGLPAQGLSSVTIVGNDPVLADGYATAVLAMGTEKGMRLIEKTPGIEGLLITGEGNVLRSSGFGGG